MIRTIAGVLSRDGAPDERTVDRLRSAVGAEARGAQVDVARSGALAVAFSGGPPERTEGGIVLVDGIVDAGLDADRADAAAFATGLRGDHAVLSWDRGRGALISDQIGGRGWVFHDDGTCLLFATEVACLLRVLPARPAVDAVCIAHWLALSGGPADRTFYAGVLRLQPGHLLDLDPAQRRSPRRYWDPAPPRGRDERSFEEVAEQLRGALQASVARRSTGARTAVLLSGGLDSASVAGLAGSLPAQARPSGAYSAVFPRHPSVDESELIAEMAVAAGLPATTAVVTSGSVIAGSLDLLERWALPSVSPNLFFWTPMQRQAVADGVEVMLDGEGGDELFGTSPYLLADRLARGDLRGAVALVKRMPGAAGGVDRRVVARALRRFGVAGLAPAWTHGLSRRARPTRAYVSTWLRDATARDYVGSVDGGAWKRNRGPRWFGHLQHVTTRDVGPVMTYEHYRQRAALAGALLPRHPLMDVDVVELMLGAPPELAFDPALSRPLLRAAVAGLVPDALRLRPDKSTFGAIFEASLENEDRPVLQALLGDRNARVGAYVDLDVMRRELIDPGPPADPHGRLGWAFHVWRLATAECFLRFQEDAAAPRRVVEAAGAAPPRVEIRRA